MSTFCGIFTYNIKTKTKMTNQMTQLEWIKSIQNSKSTDSETKEWIQHLLDSNLEIDRIHGMVLREISRIYEESMGIIKHKNYISENNC